MPRFSSFGVSSFPLSTLFNLSIVDCLNYRNVVNFVGFLFSKLYLDDRKQQQNRNPSTKWYSFIWWMLFDIYGNTYIFFSMRNTVMTNLLMWRWCSVSFVEFVQRPLLKIHWNHFDIECEKFALITMVNSIYSCHPIRLASFGKCIELLSAY